MTQVFGALGLRTGVLLAALVGAAVVLLPILMCARHHPAPARRATRRIAAATLACWPLVIVSATLLGATTADQGINMVPLQDLLSMRPEIMLTNAAGNVLLFMVPAVAARILLADRLGVAGFAATATAISVVIELAQLALGRNVSVDDVGLNTLGALVGYLIGAAVRQRLFADSRLQASA